ncbi:MAG TPA: serine hydrolase, partial [Nannocystaceae bacterium]|nr:serine hydrolase [Nannocystaceae bacterium]
RAHVIEPLALADTRAATSEPGAAIACGHLREATGWRAYDVAEDWRTLAFGVDAVAPSGAAIASASDLVRFALALSDRPPAGTPPELAAMLHDLRSRSVPTSGDDRYALGLHVRALPDGTTLLRHAGNTGDFAADVAWVPERGFAVAVLGNTGVHLRATLAAALARAGIDPRVLATSPEPAPSAAGSGPTSSPRDDPAR